MAAAPIPIPANAANAILYLVFMPVLPVGVRSTNAGCVAHPAAPL
jgi:hypothetical protein